MDNPILKFQYGAADDSGDAIPVVAADSLESAVEYAELPAEKWVQLNSATNRFTLQVRLRKLAPEDAHRDPSSGVFYVYGVNTFIVHINRGCAPAPSCDKDRALVI